MTETRPAGFWIRAVALALDFAVFFLVQASLGFLGARVWGPEVGDLPGFLPLVWFFTLVFAALYTAGLHALGGQTIGKLLVGVRVVGADGEPPPLGTALLRWTAYFASLGTLGLGYAMAGLRQDRRALHDLIAGTRVERLPRRLDAPEPVDDPHASAPLAQPPG